VVYAPSNPLGVAIQNKFRTGLGEIKRAAERISKSPSPGPRELVDGQAREQQLCEFSLPLRRPAPVPDDLEAFKGPVNSANGWPRLGTILRARASLMHPPRAEGSRQPICSARATMMPAGPRR
jgi:hypothetical protein